MKLSNIGRVIPKVLNSLFQNWPVQLRSGLGTFLVCLAFGAIPSLAEQAEDSSAVNVDSAKSEIFAAALRSSDIERTTNFLTEGLGLILLREYDADGVINRVFGYDKGEPGQGLFVFGPASPDEAEPVEQGSGFSRMMLRVPDIEAVAARLEAAGLPAGQVYDGSEQFKVLMVTDHDGYRYELLQILAQ